MTHNKINKTLHKGAISLLAVPIVCTTVGIKHKDVSAAPKVGIYNPSPVKISSRVTGTGHISKPSISSMKYKLTTSEKVLGGISLGVGAIGLVGTAVGLGLTESQYKQAKDNYHNVVERTYDSFYDEREKYMKSLFSQWGVPMPEKYKNPIKHDEKPAPSPGFSIGGGK